MAVAGSFVGGQLLEATPGGSFGKREHDPNLVILLSDLHVNGMYDVKPWLKERHQEQNLEFTVNAILRMEPLPANVIVFGDLSCLFGYLNDYVCVKKYFKRLEDAGINLTLGVGNHDRRETFLEAFPSYVKSPVPGRIVTALSLPHADLLMLDTLNQGTDPDAFSPVPGTIDKVQGEWLKESLPKWPRPVFVCHHHPVRELQVCGRPFEELLMASPNVVGVIRGHAHHWSKTAHYRHWTKTDTKRELGLPSACNWGDIGYAVLRLHPDHAVVELRQRDYWYPRPDMPKDPSWAAMTAENQGQKCRFEIRLST